MKNGGTDQRGLRWQALPPSMLVYGGILALGICSVARFIKKVQRSGMPRKQRDKELHNALDAARAANQAKGDFLANMSHEIRTPMNAVIGLSNLLLDSNLTFSQRDCVHKIRTSGTALLGVLNDILDYSKIEAGQLNMDWVPFQISDVLEKCDALFSVHTDNKNLLLRFEVTPSVPETLLGDPLRLLQVLTNLIGNAVKFTERGAIEVRLECIKDNGDFLTLKVSVIDTGVGMTPIEQERIFAPFQQAGRSTTQYYGGTGLGLTISKHLVELLGGEIGLKSEPGNGSVFWFTARLGKIPNTPARNGESKGSIKGHEMQDLSRLGKIATPIRGASVLVVDDNAINLLVTRVYLRKMGLAVTTVRNSQAAIEKTMNTRFDAVLMDLHMPDRDGFETASRIREEEEKGDPDGARFPIMALTASAMPIDMQAALASGMNDHVVKPIDPFHLAEILVKWIPATSGVLE